MYLYTSILETNKGPTLKQIFLKILLHPTIHNNYNFFKNILQIVHLFVLDLDIERENVAPEQENIYNLCPGGLGIDLTCNSTNLSDDANITMTSLPDSVMDEVKCLTETDSCSFNGYPRGGGDHTFRCTADHDILELSPIHSDLVVEVRGKVS